MGRKRKTNKSKSDRVKVGKEMKRPSLKRPNKGGSLRERLSGQLEASRFRYINEQLYTRTGTDAVVLFDEDPEAFRAYHDGYMAQLSKWPIDPLIAIIGWLKSKPSDTVVADFGCGNGRLGKSVRQTVHSFDLVAVDESVVACDMSMVPLLNESVDVAVFCLSLMGSNLADYLREANRVLKTSGTLKVAEIASRFTSVATFLKSLGSLGFECTKQDILAETFWRSRFGGVHFGRDILAEKLFFHKKHELRHRNNNNS